jgi:hypothetical protein
MYHNTTAVFTITLYKFLCCSILLSMTTLLKYISVLCATLIRYILSLWVLFNYSHCYSALVNEHTGVVKETKTVKYF